MTKWIVLLVVVAIGWFAYQRHYVPRLARAAATENSQPARTEVTPPRADTSSPFKCDGRTHCSQMTSCAEATYFLKNCPGTKMDGNNDGVPCEKQWCK